MNLIFLKMKILSKKKNWNINNMVVLVVVEVQIA